MNSIAERATSFSTAVETSPAIDLSTPKFVLPFGRGRTGKSLLARWLVERARSQHRHVIAGDADPINPSLAPYFQDTLCLSSHMKNGLYSLGFPRFCDRQIAEKLSSVVDLGPGGAPIDDLSKLGRFSVLDAAHIRPIAIHLVGPRSRRSSITSPICRNCSPPRRRSSSSTKPC